MGSTELRWSAGRLKALVGLYVTANATRAAKKANSMMTRIFSELIDDLYTYIKMLGLEP
ncbi:MAG TPA: hypothetical protein VM715_16790 [Candidatus Acidoferrum sp.]|jgi:hypothetical protein|nr:hypothetical protein [Candidatus Acidoferrum sp.]